MTDVLKALVERGWTGPVPDHLNDTLYVYASQSQLTHRPMCDCNDKLASLCVIQYDMKPPGPQYKSYEVALRFEKNGLWYDLKAYSLRTLEDVDKAIDPVIAAGMAVSNSPQPINKDHHE
jgi:hypothetical protein